MNGLQYCQHNHAPIIARKRFTVIESKRKSFIVRKRAIGVKRINDPYTSAEFRNCIIAVWIVIGGLLLTEIIGRWYLDSVVAGLGL